MPTIGRTALVTAVVALRAYVVFLVVANVALLSGGVERLLRGKGEQMRVRYTSAWTLWPGRLHARNLVLTFQDAKVQFELTMPSSWLQINLLDLARREFHAEHVRAEGTKFRLRTRVQDLDEDELRVAAFPTIPGLPDPPLASSGPTVPPVTDTDYRLWTVDLEDVRASVDELWVMEWRYGGAARVEGAFRLKPLRELSVGPANVWFDGGSVGFGPQVVARNARGRAGCTMPRFDVRVPQGGEMLRQLTATAQLRAETQSLSFLRAYLGEGATVDGGAGELAVDLAVERGVVLAGSSARLASEEVKVSLGGLALHGDVALHGSVEDGNAGGRATVSVASRQARVCGAARCAGDTVAVVRGGRAAASASSSDLTASWELAGLRAEVETVTVPDVRALQRFAGDVRDVALLGGSLVGSAKIDAYGPAVTGSADVRFANVRLRVKDTDAQASGRIVSALAAPSLGNRGSLRKVRVTLDDVRLHAGDRDTEGWWARLEGEELPFVAYPRASLSGDLRLRAKSAEPLMNVLVAKGAVGRPVASLVPLPELTAALFFKHGHQGTELHVREARSGPLQAAGSVKVAPGGHPAGRFNLKVGPVPIGIELREGDTKVTPFAQLGTN